MKAYKQFLTSLFLLFLSITLFAPERRTTKAQVSTCAGNIVTNGNFTSGLTSGAMPNPGAVAGWSSAYGTPDVATGMGWQDPGYVSMWGNLNPTIGEGLQQTLSNSLVAGRTYIVSFGARTNYVVGSNQSYARFKVRASNSQLPNAGAGITVGLSSSITGTAGWTPVSFTWTAPANLQRLTLSVENNSNADDGAMTSSGSFDNFCIREVPPDFTATNLCLGQFAAFTSNAPGATSWSWDFGDNSQTSTQQNPTHNYVASGTYNVKLCVNGTTNCVTKPVTISQPPPSPVINGPTNTCNGLTATYSVAAVGGVSYTWNISNGTINGASTGSSVNVTWNSAGGGGISVTATNLAGCSLRATTLRVFDCKVWLDKCCDAIKLNATAPVPVHVGNNVYAFTPTLTTPNNVIRVAANVISTEQVFSSASCGTNGPVSSHIVSVSSPASFIGSLPVAFSHEAIWHAPGGLNLGGGLAFPFQIKFPAAPAGKFCSDVLKFCVKYTFTTATCRSCEIIRCYSITRKKIIIWWDDIIDVRVITVGRSFNVRVEVETPDGGRTGALTIGIKPGTGALGARVRGRTTAEVVNGTATFSDISVDRAGTGYVLVVSGGGLREPIESDPFDVVQGTPQR